MNRATDPVRDELLAVLLDVIERQGIDHDPTEDGDECPADDTCTCPFVVRVNAAIRAAEDA